MLAGFSRKQESVLYHSPSISGQVDEEASGVGNLPTDAAEVRQ
jgi:hypothetical protein